MFPVSSFPEKFTIFRFGRFYQPVAYARFILGISIVSKDTNPVKSNYVF
jgi:hypothetical protein